MEVFEWPDQSTKEFEGHAQRDRSVRVSTLIKMDFSENYTLETLEEIQHVY